MVLSEHDCEMVGIQLFCCVELIRRRRRNRQRAARWRPVHLPRDRRYDMLVELDAGMIDAMRALHPGLSNRSLLETALHSYLARQGFPFPKPYQRAYTGKGAR